MVNEKVRFRHRKKNGHEHSPRPIVHRITTQKLRGKRATFCSNRVASWYCILFVTLLVGCYFFVSVEVRPTLQTFFSDVDGTGEQLEVAALSLPKCGRSCVLGGQ